MFGIGYQEMMVIALIALVIFGPGKLPEVMRQAGQQYAKFKSMADQMTGELNKVTADARKELDGALGDLGPMGKDLEKSLGLKGNTTRTTSSGTKSSSSASKKTTSTSSAASKRTTTSSASKSKTASKTSSTNATPQSKSKTTTATTASKKPVVATKEDPLADFDLFEGVKKESKKRVRSAAPSAITDFTPRDIFVETAEEVAEQSPLSGAVDISTLEDPIARARARRQTAGYARV